MRAIHKFESARVSMSENGNNALLTVTTACQPLIEITLMDSVFFRNRLQRIRFCGLATVYGCCGKYTTKVYGWLNLVTSEGSISYHSTGIIPYLDNPHLPPRPQTPHL
jgi:hypothetical protein